MKVGRRISNGSSVFTSELMAILWALKWIEETRSREVIICSDSATALEALRRGKSKARADIIIDILTVFFRIGFRSNITFCWVPGHTGVGGNEQVDQIAKQSLNREVDVQVSWGRVELREIIKEGLMKEWQRGWEKESRGRHYFSLQPQVGVDTTSLYNVKLKKRFTCTFQSRRDSGKLCRLRLGRCGLNHSLFIVGKHVSGSCECGSSETVKHVFLECRK